MGSTAVRIVNRTDEGRGWAVREVLGLSPVAVMRRKDEALAYATYELERAREGGQLQVYGDDGLLEQERRVHPPAPAASAAGGATAADESLGEQFEREGEVVDDGLEALTGTLALLGGPAVAVLISPEVQGAISDGWFAVFLATLTWSLGCLLTTVLLRRSGLGGWPLVNSIVLSFVLSLGLANALGRGVLDIEPAMAAGPGTPFGHVVSIVEVAVRTYGPLGAVISGAIGVWLGDRVSQRLGD